jgi:hypothetical protein
MNKISYVCYACGSIMDGEPTALPKGWVLPKNCIVDHGNINAMKRTAGPGTIIALCSASCFNTVTQEKSNDY